MHTDVAATHEGPTVVRRPEHTEPKAVQSPLRRSLHSLRQEMKSERGSISLVGLAGGMIITGYSVAAALRLQRRILDKDASTFSRHVLAALPIGGAALLGAAATASLGVHDGLEDPPDVAVVETRGAAVEGKLIVGKPADGNTVAIYALPPKLDPIKVTIRQVRPGGEEAPCADVLVEDKLGNRTYVGSYEPSDSGSHVAKQLPAGKGCTINRGDDVSLEGIGL